MKILVLIALLAMTSCESDTPKVGDCYIGASDRLVKVVEVLKYGLFWETQLPTENTHAYTKYYETFPVFSTMFPDRADCWTDKKVAK